MLPTTAQSLRRALALIAAACLGGGCGGCDDGPTPHVFDPPLSACEVPAPPAPLPTDAVVGDGTPGSCTEAALRDALAAGGNITFDCGSGNVTIDVGAEVRVPQDAILDGDPAHRGAGGAHRAGAHLCPWQRRPGSGGG
jgi:hypothetical protein